MRKKKNLINKDSKLRTTKHGTKVRILEKLANDIYLVEAITRNGVFTTQVTEEGLQ